MKHLRIDKPLALLVFVLLIGGCMIFASAAFGTLARGGTTISSIVFSHLILGVGMGFILLLITTAIDYRHWKRFAPYIFGFAIIATALVFVPHLGAEHGGGKRWIVLAHLSFQPSEALKIASIILAAAYFSAMRAKTDTLQWGLGGLIGILALPALLLVMQPDIGTLGVICFSVLAIFFAAGARFRDIAILICIALLALGALAYEKPYIRDRVVTFFYPAQGQQAEGYQIRQSLIAIGSGGFIGRGFGQGVQKFTYLPEPMGDSIFAVAGEELGFVGTFTIVLLFLLFGNAALQLDVFHTAKLGLDRIDLCVECDDLVFGSHGLLYTSDFTFDTVEIIFRRHMFDDVSQHLANFLESSLLYHARIINGVLIFANVNSGLGEGGCEGG